MSEETDFARGVAEGSGTGIAQGYQTGFAHGWERRFLNGSRAGLVHAAPTLPPNNNNLDYVRGWREGYGADYGRSFDQGHIAGYGAAAVPVVHPAAAAVVSGLQPASAPAPILMTSSSGSSSTVRGLHSPHYEYAPLSETRDAPAPILMTSSSGSSSTERGLHSPHYALLSETRDSSPYYALLMQTRNEPGRTHSQERGRHFLNPLRRSQTPGLDFGDMVQPPLPMNRLSRMNGSRDNEHPYIFRGRSRSPMTTSGRGQSDYAMRETRLSGAAQEHQSGHHEEAGNRRHRSPLGRGTRWVDHDVFGERLRHEFQRSQALSAYNYINGTGVNYEEEDGFELSSVPLGIEGLIDVEPPTVYTRRTADITNSTNPTSDWFGDQRPFDLHQSFPQTLQLTPTTSEDSEGGHTRCAICLCEFRGREGDCMEPVVVTTTGCVCRVVVGLPCLRRLCCQANPPSCLHCRRVFEVYDQPLEVHDEHEDGNDQDEINDRHTPIRAFDQPLEIEDQAEVDDRHTPIYAFNQPSRFLDQDDEHNDIDVSEHSRIHTDHIDRHDQEHHNDHDDPNSRNV